MLYSVTAQVEYKRKDGVISGQVPAFILDGRTQGIHNKEHAAIIAEDIINPTRSKRVKVHVHVIEVDREVWAK